MPPWAEDCLRLCKQKGYLTCAELWSRFPSDADVEPINDLIDLLKKEGVLFGDGDPDAFARYSPDDSREWKSYPAHVVGPSLSRCHQQPTVLVQSKKSGFVSANCSRCGKPDTLSPRCFERLPLWVSCPSCKRRMEPCVACKVRAPAVGAPCKVDTNYKYACFRCRLFVLLADLLPDWDDLGFPPAS
jgi:hypothetical protein